MPGMTTVASVYGEKPRPRILFLGAVEDAEVLEDSFRSVFGVRTIRVIENLAEVHQPEWDAVISTESVPVDASEHLFFITFGSVSSGRPDQIDEGLWPLSRVSYFGKSLASELLVPAGLPRQIARLVRSDLLPYALNLGEHDTLVLGLNRPNYVKQLPASFVPFLATTAGDSLAGMFTREGGVSHCWVLPRYADPKAWVRLALSEWSAIAPDRFPHPPAWWESTQWQTYDEKVQVNELDQLVDEHRKIRAELNRRVSAAKESIHRAKEQADLGVRRLLTAQGDDLKAAVSAAFEFFGFEVEDVDQTRFGPGQRREDLRLTLPDRRNWVALVEVRGYTGGGRALDLMRLQRFAQLYESDEGLAPSGVWYAANQFLNDPPDERPTLLDSADEELTFLAANHHGLAMDTVDLFRLVQAVERGDVPAQTARELLLSAEKLFQYT
jgi:hypothetical protein